MNGLHPNPPTSESMQHTPLAHGSLNASSATDRRGRYIYIACPWTPVGGGMYKVADYLIQSQAAQTPPQAAQLRPLDSRGAGSPAMLRCRGRRRATSRARWATSPTVAMPGTTASERTSPRFGRAAGTERANRTGNFTAPASPRAMS